MEILKEVLTRILGMHSIVDYLVLTFFIMIGVTLSLKVLAYHRDTNSPNTPTDFNWRFFFLDNLKRAIKSIFTIFLVIRFGEQVTGKELTEWGAVLIGFCLDLVGEIINNKLTKFKCAIRDKFKDNDFNL